MSAKPKYVELLFKSSAGGELPSHPLAGYVIVSDYVGDQGRHLFLRRGAIEPQPAAPAKPAPKKRTKKAKASAPAAESNWKSLPVGDGTI